MTISKLLRAFSVATACALSLTACFKDDDTTPATQKGQLSLEMTDAPIDDPNVQGVFVTVAAVKVDGQDFSGFSGKKTLDLMAYQQGEVALLGVGDLDAGAHHTITLVLDHTTDANGQTPGAYVLLKNGMKHALGTDAAQSLTIHHVTTITANQQTNLVIDFDLRKAVQYQSSGADPYDFVATANLTSALRVVEKSQSGEIKGNVDNSLLVTDKIVAYAYTKGQFNRDVEVQSQNGLSFKNAVTSAAVDANGNFTLAFLPAGDYEVHFAAYKDTNNDGKLDFQGTLLVTSGLSLDLNALRLDAAANLNLDLTVTGILP